MSVRSRWRVGHVSGSACRAEGPVIAQSGREQRMEWFDISVPITPGMVTFEGDPSVSLERTASMADGDICNVSQLSFGVHSGTHVDAPVHFIPNAAGIEAVPLATLVGPTEVVAIDEPSAPIDAAAVARLTL